MSKADGYVEPLSEPVARFEHLVNGGTPIDEAMLRVFELPDLSPSDRSEAGLYANARSWLSLVPPSLQFSLSQETIDPVDALVRSVCDARPLILGPDWFAERLSLDLLTLLPGCGHISNWTLPAARGREPQNGPSMTIKDEMKNELTSRSPTLICHFSDGRFPEEPILLNALALELGVKFLPIRMRATKVEVGPLVLPRVTACYVCYERRLASSLGWLATTNGPPPPPYAKAFLLGMSASEIVRSSSQFMLPLTRGRVWELDWLTGASDISRILRLPRCPGCGLSELDPPRPLWEEM